MHLFARERVDIWASLQVVSGEQRTSTGRITGCDNGTSYVSKHGVAVLPVPPQYTLTLYVFGGETTSLSWRARNNGVARILPSVISGS